MLSLLEVNLTLNVFSSIGGPQTATPNCDATGTTPLLLNEDQTQAIRYSYRVSWNVSESILYYIQYSNFIFCIGIRYTLGRFKAFIANNYIDFAIQATRWDNYLHVFDPRIHWISLINSVVVVVLLCGMVSMILFRSVSRDVSNFLRQEGEFENFIFFVRYTDTMLLISAYGA